jgi:hypothetical protein
MFILVGVRTEYAHAETRMTNQYVLRSASSWLNGNACGLRCHFPPLRLTGSDVAGTLKPDLALVAYVQYQYSSA